MKKKLNIEGIANELEGASAFFRRNTPAPSPPAGTAPAQNDPAPAASAEGQHPAQDPRNEPTTERKNVSTNQRTFVRRKIRHTFDIYDDQLLSLREIAIERQKVFGERVLLGDLVQEALDALIAKERNKE